MTKEVEPTTFDMRIEWDEGHYDFEQKHVYSIKFGRMADIYIARRCRLIVRPTSVSFTDYGDPKQYEGLTPDELMSSRYEKELTHVTVQLS